MKKRIREGRNHFILFTVILTAGLGFSAVSAMAGVQNADRTEKYPNMPHMSYEEYPEVDGSLACVPLMEALIEAVTGCDEGMAEESLTEFSNTNPSYRRLQEGEADLILSYEASPGEDLADPAWDGPNVWLEKGSFAVMGRRWEGEPSCIYDTEGTLLFSTRGRLYKWMDGNYSLLRGAHTGIIDRSGKWLIKEYYAKE